MCVQVWLKNIRYVVVQSKGVCLQRSNPDLTAFTSASYDAHMSSHVLLRCVWIVLLRRAFPFPHSGMRVLDCPTSFVHEIFIEADHAHR